MKPPRGWAESACRWLQLRRTGQNKSVILQCSSWELPVVMALDGMWCRRSVNEAVWTCAPSTPDVKLPKNNGKKNLHSCSQNHLFLINKLLISHKRQKISKKLEANFNTNTSKTMTCVSHHIYCASLTNNACARGGRVQGEIGAHALSFINSATQESWEDKEEDTVAQRQRRWLIASQT